MPLILLFSFFASWLLLSISFAKAKPLIVFFVLAPCPLKRPASDLRCKIIHDVRSAYVRVYQVTPSGRYFCTAVPNCMSYNDTLPRPREVRGLNLSSVSLYPDIGYSGYSRVFGVFRVFEGIRGI